MSCPENAFGRDISGTKISWVSLSNTICHAGKTEQKVTGNKHMSPSLLAAIWMIGAILSFSSMAVAGRFVLQELDTFELMLYRSVFGVFIVVAAAIWSGTLKQIEGRNFRLHLLRNCFHFTGQNLWFFALGVIPLAQVFAFEFTSPIWVVLLAPLLLGERLTRLRILTALLGFLGILIVARPTFGTVNMGMLSALLAAIGFAGTAIFTKKLTRKTGLTGILFYLTAMQAVMAFVLAGYDADIAIPSGALWPWIALIAVAGLIAHFCLTKALSLAPASIVIPMDFARLPLIAVIGMAFYNEPLDIYVFVGAAIIFLANMLNIRAQLR